MHSFGLEAQGQTVVQCRQNEILQQQTRSSRAVLTQIGHASGRLEAQGQTTVQFRQNKTLQQQKNSIRACQTRSGMYLFGWKTLQPYLERSEF